jgi:parallel beta-helix repeat protein
MGFTEQAGTLTARSWLARGGVAASLMITLAAQAAPVTSIEGVSYFVAPGGVGVSTDREAPGGINESIGKVCDGTPEQITGGDAIVFLDGRYLTSGFNLPLPPDERQPGRAGNAIAMLDADCGGPLYIKLLADNRLGAVIVNDVSANDTSGGFDIRNSSYVWIEGFHIIGVNDPLVPWEGGIKFSDGSHHVVARDNLIENAGGGGIGVGGATHARILNNEVRNSANRHPFCASGISLYKLQNPAGFSDDASGYANYIVGNKVFGTRSKPGCDADVIAENGIVASDGNCIILDLFNATGYTNRTLIANNLCVNNGGGGVHVFNSSHADVINNTLYGNGVVHRLGELSVSCWPTGAVADVRFANNLVWATSTAPAVATTFNSACALSGIVHANNVFVGNGPLIDDFIGTPYLPITTELMQLRNGSNSNLVGVTPLEIAIKAVDTDPLAADFTITAATSPAVDAGIREPCDPANPAACSAVVPPSEVASDLGGLPRISGAAVDVGAHEYPGAGEPIEPVPPLVTVRAAASLAAGIGATMEVRVNGTVVGTAVVGTPDLNEYPFPIAFTDPIERVDVVFTNDAIIGEEDRNLHIDAVTINRRVFRPTDAGVLIDKGLGEAAFDDVDVVPGQRGLWWNGALRIVLPRP